MKKFILIAFFSLLLFSIAFAAIDTRPGVAIDISRTGAYKILDVSCFLNDARVASTVTVTEIDSAGNVMLGTSKSFPSRDGRVTLRLTPAKSYRIDAYQGEGIRSFVESPPSDFINFEHSTALGLALERSDRGTGK